MNDWEAKIRTWMEKHNKSGELVTCETTAAYLVHVRVVSEKFPIKLSGHPRAPAPQSSCDMEVSWDTRIPVTIRNITCRSCRACYERHLTERR